MQAYLSLLQKILDDGVIRNDRTGVGTCGIFGHQIRFGLDRHFPLLTTKRVHMRSVIYELLWFLRGDTNIAYLNENGVTIWDEWADARGELGPVYGAQWRAWKTADGGHIDQIAQLVAQLKSNPESRRHIVSAWNPAVIHAMALPPCHCLFQFYVTPAMADTSETRGRLSCQLYQRSADVFLGVPFNIASYALLTLMLAHVCDLEAGEFIYTIGDAHLYLNHIEQARMQLQRTPGVLPTMHLNTACRDIFAFSYDDFDLRDYHPQAHIAAPIAV